MDWLPHTEADIAEMLDTIGMGSLDDLFEAVPGSVRVSGALDVAPALSEPELLRHLRTLSKASSSVDDLVCFAGGGAYDHHVPPVVRALASRAEFATSYTPYQPELSQGVLQALFEFQSMICEIYGLEVANASLYDGANALVEAVNLAVRVTGKERIAVGETVSPHYRQVLETCTSGLGLEVVTVPAGPDGAVSWEGFESTDLAAVVVASPNFFGVIEDVAAAASAAHSTDALCIAASDPTALGILEAPGVCGADVAVGEGQSLGNILSYGGPYVGLFATRLEHVRQVPGRIAGQTSDADGRRAFVLTLQAREQHIRRARATSNVCTNQTLMAIAAAIHLAWLGPRGLRRLGDLCLEKTARAMSRLSEVPGCEPAFAGPVFKEFVLRTPIDAAELSAGLARRGFLAGPALGKWYPDLSDCLLIAATELRTDDEIHALAEAFEKELAER